MTRPPDESFSRLDRLRRRQEFLRCYRKGGKRHGAFASLHFHARESSEDARTRLGITASRKVGKAVVRHRVKRRVREIFRRWPRRDALGPVDIVVHLKPAAAKAGFAEFEREIVRLFDKIRRLNRPL